MRIEEIAKRIYGIRKAMGYATKEQIAEGVGVEIKFVKNMIKDLKRDMIHRCGGFSFGLTSSGKSVIITPDFKFMLRLKK